MNPQRTIAWALPMVCLYIISQSQSFPVASKLLSLVGPGTEETSIQLGDLLPLLGQTLVTGSYTSQSNNATTPPATTSENGPVNSTSNQETDNLESTNQVEEGPTDVSIQKKTGEGQQSVEVKIDIHNNINSGVEGTSDNTTAIPPTTTQAQPTVDAKAVLQALCILTRSCNSIDPW